MPPPIRTAATTFDRVAIDLAHAAFPQMAAAIRARLNPILTHWRGVSLKAMPHLDALTLKEFENSIEAILSAAADAFQSANPQHLRGVVEGAPAHGLARFVQQYSLLDLFEEVRILRSVVILELAKEMKRPLDVGEAATFHAIFDIIVQQGVIALVEQHAEQAERHNKTLQETNQRLLLASARQHELAAIVESSDDAIISKDLNGVITTWNKGAEHLFGYTAEEVIGKPIALLIPEDRLDDEPSILGPIGRGESVEHYETIRRRKDGRRLSISLTVSPIRDSMGRIVGASKIARDITGRVAMEQQIKEQAAALASESRRKDEFLAMLSHELRNPLAPIRSAVYLMRLQERGSENLIQKQAREIIERQVANLTKLVSDLLEVSRVVSGRIRLERQAVDLNRVLQHAIETATPMIQQRRHEFTLHPCPEVDGLWVNVDPTRMEEVVVNLLNNAAKYTPDGGRIEVWCERRSGSDDAQVRVRDSGVGIDKELLPRIFDLFTQADRSLERSAGGLGIGLSLAQRLVDLHGGTIEAHSPPVGESKGSEFIVRLPLIATPQTVQVSPAPAADSKTAEGLRILLVDDNIDLVMMLSSTLRQKGYGVHVAYNGPDGLRAAQEWRPDVVLMDIGLPRLDGYEVARRLRSDPNLGGAGGKMKLIALSGYGRESDRSLARKAGFDAHLIKPVEFKALESTIASLTSPPMT